MAPVSGRYSDNKTAASHRVRVAFDESALVFHIEGAASTENSGGSEPSEARDEREGQSPRPHVWPFETLRAPRPVAPGAPDVLLQSEAEPGATLFVTEPGFAEALLARAPELGAKAQLWRFARPALVVAALFAAAIFAIWMSGLSPARTLAGLMPDELRRAAGEQLFRTIAAKHPICHDAAAREALDQLYRRLTGKRALAKGDAFDIRLVDWRLVNAFALPGNIVVLTRGLIDQARGPDEVAGVLAHELSHGLARHPETALMRSLGLAVAAEMIFVGGSETLASLGLLLVQLRYTRAAEREADRQALALLRQAGISAKPLAAFFARMREKEKESPTLKTLEKLRFLSSHPPTPEREALFAAARAYPTRPSLAPRDWQALRAACKSAVRP